MERMIAYCGLVCSECDAYVATQAGDVDALTRLAQQARDEYGVEDATAETTMCDGCLGTGGRSIGYCSICDIRACGVERRVANCGCCPDYACEKLEGFLAEVASARTVLDDVRASL